MNVSTVGSDGDISLIVTGLLLLGLVGFLLTRRWHRAIIAILPLTLYGAGQLAAWATAAWREEVPGHLFRHRLAELALIGIVAVVGVGLPLLGMRRSRSRPAA